MGNIYIYKCCPSAYNEPMKNGDPAILTALSFMSKLLLEEGLAVEQISPSSLHLPSSNTTINFLSLSYLIPSLSEDILALLRPHQAEGVHPVMVTINLSRGLFEQCREAGINVLDGKENGFIRIPGFRYERFIEETRKGRPAVKGTPFPMKASRIVRALLSEPDHDWSQVELAKATGVTQGYLSIQQKVLQRSGYIRVEERKLRVVDHGRLLSDWAEHYRFDRHQQSRYAFNATTYEEGLDHLGKIFRALKLSYAFTGWSGALLRAPYGIPDKWMAFIERIPDAPEQHGLYPVDQNENALLIVPQDIGVFQFSQEIKGLRVVSDPQLYIDLRKMPGRATEQAEVLRNKYLNRGIPEDV